jgi:hypothetical protein
VEIIRTSRTEAASLSDGDEAGERCAIDILTKMSPHRFCRWVKFDDGVQPTGHHFAGTGGDERSV